MTLFDSAESLVKGRGGKIKVVFKNQDFIVINKPDGISFHSENASAGLVVLVKEQQSLDELYPVHRLDKMTSGLILFALNKQTAQAFQVLFETRQMQKFYLAISDKKPKKKQGWVIGDMLSARRGNYKLAKSRDNPARTQFISVSIGSGLRLYLVKPITGKTHQIRVALKSIGAPILGDIRYADAKSAQQANRGYLHAFAIQFTLYEKAYEFVVSPIDVSEHEPKAGGGENSPPPLLNALNTWKKPWDQFS